MASQAAAAEAPPHSKFFTQTWTITVPSYPSLTYIRATPSLFDVWLPLVTSRANNEAQGIDTVWKEAKIDEWKQYYRTRYGIQNLRLRGLDLLICLDGKVVGYGDVTETAPGVANVGIILNPEARGKGVGKVTVRVFAQLGFEMGMTIEAGTMKANGPMRGLMKSLGIAEVEEIVDIPGRGVVAELVYKIDRRALKEIDMRVEFGMSTDKSNVDID